MHEKKNTFKACVLTEPVYWHRLDLQKQFIGKLSLRQHYHIIDAHQGRN